VASEKIHHQILLRARHETSPPKTISPSRSGRRRAPGHVVSREVITNPPFRLAEDFISRALPLARHGVAILARTVFLESIGRYEGIFRDNPPTKFAQFTERVPMVRGRLDIKASTATGYAWLVWEKSTVGPPLLTWVPPCRKQLERKSDYALAGS
jgi:hypothetical protein